MLFDPICNAAKRTGPMPAQMILLFDRKERSVYIGMRTILLKGRMNELQDIWKA